MVPERPVAVIASPSLEVIVVGSWFVVVGSLVVVGPSAGGGKLVTRTRVRVWGARGARGSRRSRGGVSDASAASFGATGAVTGGAGVTAGVLATTWIALVLGVSALVTSCRAGATRGV